METVKLKEALAELRKDKERKFDQSVELIINLKGIDMKRDQVNAVVKIPNKIKDKKICAFLNEKSKTVKTITEPEFKKYTEKNELKKIVNEFDYFIAVAKLMPKVATTFGKVLGPVGKMPSPQLGMITDESDETIRKEIDKISTSLKIRLKEPSIKVTVGKVSMADEKIIENVNSVYKSIENALPKKRDNVKNIMVKLTMSKPVKTEVA